MTLLARLIAGLAATLFATSCGHENGAANQPDISYAPREPGSGAVPTHDLSFQLIAQDGPTRFVSWQAILSRAGRQCNIVTGAILIGGLDGTDEWRVKCADSGTWAVSLTPETIDITRCSTANCTR